MVPKVALRTAAPEPRELHRPTYPKRSGRQRRLSAEIATLDLVILRHYTFDPVRTRSQCHGNSSGIFVQTLKRHYRREVTEYLETLVGIWISCSFNAFLNAGSAASAGGTHHGAFF